MPYTLTNVRVFPWLSWDDVGLGYYPLAWSEPDIRIIARLAWDERFKTFYGKKWASGARTYRKYEGVRLCTRYA